MSENALLLAARAYTSRGFYVVPIPPGGNRPLQDKWQELRICENELQKYFGQAENIGLLLSPSGLVDVDCDCTEAAVVCQILLPRTEMVHGHVSNPSSHFYFRGSNITHNLKFVDPRRPLESGGCRSTIIEVRVNGQTVVPPSINQRSGEPVFWERQGEPAHVDGFFLCKCVGRVASAALIARCWPKGARHNATLALAGMLFRSGWLDEDVEEFVRAVVVAAHDEEGASRLLDIVSTSKRLAQNLPATGAPTLVEIIGRDVVDRVCEWLELPVAGGSAESLALHQTDLGNVQRLVITHGKNLRFDCDSGRWLVWNESRWVYDATGQVERFAKETVRRIYLEANDCAHQADRTMLVRHALRSEGEGRIRAMVNLAKTEASIAVEANKLNADEMLLNCANGVLDLRAGKLLPHSRELLCTKILAITFDSRALCPLWLKFLDQIFGGNQSLISFLQRAMGYSLTGKTIEQVLFLLHGTGANGKTTFIETAKALLASYANQANFETFLATKIQPNHNDLARFQGARFVAAVEAGEGRTLNETVIKQVTGGDSISTRFLYREYFEFRPQFKLWLVANNKPRVAGTDEAIWRRIRLIPFDVTVLPAERDKQLLEKLQAELPGILAWAVRGCLDWQKNGLGEPVEVLKATSQYRAEMDTLQGFIDERCELGAQYTVSAAEIYRNYKSWCEFTLEQPMSQQKFGSRLRQSDLASLRVRGQRHWRGIRIIPMDDADRDDAVDVNIHQSFR